MSYDACPQCGYYKCGTDGRCVDCGARWPIKDLRKCVQCGASDAPLYQDLGLRFCDVNCRECYLSDHAPRNLETLPEES